MQLRPFFPPPSLHTSKMSSNTNEPTHSVPIPIASRNRPRSISVSSTSSGSASSSSGPPTTPASPSVSSQRINIPSPSTSPILSYFLAQSPTKTIGAATTFPFKRKFGTTPAVFEGDSINQNFLESDVTEYVFILFYHLIQ